MVFLQDCSLYEMSDKDFVEYLESEHYVYYSVLYTDAGERIVLYREEEDPGSIVILPGDFERIKGSLVWMMEG